MKRWSHPKDTNARFAIAPEKGRYPREEQEYMLFEVTSEFAIVIVVDLCFPLEAVASEKSPIRFHQSELGDLHSSFDVFVKLGD